MELTLKNHFILFTYTNKKTIKHKKYFNRTRKITHNKNLIFPKQKPK